MFAILGQTLGVRVLVIMMATLACDSLEATIVDFELERREQLRIAQGFLLLLGEWFMNTYMCSAVRPPQWSQECPQHSSGESMSGVNVRLLRTVVC